MNRVNGSLPFANLGLLVLTLACTPAVQGDLVWRTNSNHRVAAVELSASRQVGFTLLDPASTGLVFTNELADFSAAQNRILESGSGVALGDVDGDGWCDIYLCRLEGDNRLYRNLGGWRFEDITAQAGVACPNQYSTGAVLADIDGDGDLDLLVNAIGGGTRCFLNDGKGKFTEDPGGRLAKRFSGMSMALADADGDGDLDLYVVTYGTTTYRDRPPGLNVEAKLENGKVVVNPPERFIALTPAGSTVEIIEMGERDFFYMNDGKGHFLPVSWTAGAFADSEGQPYKSPPRGWGLSLLFRDMNGDGLPDLYVCNDFFYFPDDMWFNTGGRQFRAVRARELPHCSLASMAIDAADINRDGFIDFFVADMVSRDHSRRHRQRPDLMGGRIQVPVSDPNFRPEVPRNTLFLNRGDATWVDIAPLSGLEGTEWTWGAAFLDVDLDGWEDLLIANGNNHDVQDADTLRALAQLHERPSPESRLRDFHRFGRLYTRNLAFRNRRDLTFEDVSQAWGFNLNGASYGMAMADLDNDGDLDIVLNNLHDNASLYRNDASGARVEIRLRGAGANTRGIGAKLKFTGGPVTQTQEMVSGGRYLSSDEAVRVFAAEPATRGGRMALEVTWRSGARTLVDNVQPNSIYEVFEQGATLPANLQRSPGDSTLAGPGPIQFSDETAALGYLHEEEDFNDFERQPLLSHSHSHRGPGLAWGDLGGLGHETLYVGAGKGGHPGILHYTPGKGFDRIPTTQLPPAPRSQAGVAACVGSDGHPALVVALSNYQDGRATNAVVVQVGADGRNLHEIETASESSLGPVAVADFDGDGDLELFVGGRVIPGRHPEPTSSRIYQNENGSWHLDASASAALTKVGMVSSAVFADLDQDGFAELVLACEWGPLRVFRRRGGTLEEITEPLGLASHTGWWNGVTAGDFDGDGRLDLVASNWGRNTRFQPSADHPIEVVFADFHQQGVVSSLETYYDPGLGGMVPWRDWELVTREMPWVRERLNSYRSFGEARITDILGDRAGEAQKLSARTLDSMVFLNRGGRFEAHSLPVEAQLAPAFAVVVADFDADGREDLFLSQNFFGVTLETARHDGGRGQLLRGNGDGSFTPARCGIEITGEQRGAAVADYDEDGRVDLAVAQNRGATRLFRNRSVQRGTRVRLAGPPANPNGIGCVLRMGDGTVWGPAREIHGGGGYWSQDSPVTVMAPVGKGVSRLSVLWPGGKRTETEISGRPLEVKVDAAGRLVSSKP